MDKLTKGRLVRLFLLFFLMQDGKKQQGEARRIARHGIPEPDTERKIILNSANDLLKPSRIDRE